jgi:hypothetical protein
MQTGLDLIKKDLSYLDDVLTIYLDELNNAEHLFKLKGVEITTANLEHISWANYYNQKRIEVKFIKEYVQTRVELVHGELWKKYTENHDRQLQQKDKEYYIKTEPEYLDIRYQYLKVEEIYEQLCRLCSGFDSKGYVLNNLTKLIINQSSDWTIN